jgi:hydrogenase-4 component F
MNALLFTALLSPPLLGAALAGVLPRRLRLASWINAGTMPISVMASLWMAARLMGGAHAIAAGHLWRVDALSVLFALLVALVATLASWIGPGLSTPAAADARAFRFYANLFAATMLTAVSTGNLGVMWVAVEATTVTSALLIPVHRTKASVEASWKYLLIGSVGIALAFTGTVLAFVDFSTTGGSVESALNWTTLLAAAPSLHPEVTRLAFVFLLIGFGTKAGLVPMHTWLPDAHSEAPAPLSAMMSGVLLAVALYALARWKAIIDASLGSAFTDTMLLIIAVPTILIGSLSLVTQSHFKRLLAYSSIEHTGLACFGLALGPLGVFAALLHVSGHALAKSTTFLLSGRVLTRYGTQEIAGTSGVLAVLPGTGALFGLGFLALVGLPPFSLFLSEVLLVRAGWTAGHFALTSVVLLCLLLAFGSLIHHLQRMLLGAAPPAIAAGEALTWPLVVLVLPLLALAWVGTSLPAGLTHLLTRAAEVLQP